MKRKSHFSHLFVHMLCNDDMCYMESFRYGTGPKSQINGYMQVLKRHKLFLK